MNFSFPGNIRQLKNIVEQISVLELGKQIDAETLQKYLPEDTSNARFPILYPGQQEENLSEGKTHETVAATKKTTTVVAAFDDDPQSR